MKKYATLTAFVLFSTLFWCAFCAAQNARYSNAEHGVGQPKAGTMGCSALRPDADPRSSGVRIAQRPARSLVIFAATAV